MQKIYPFMQKKIFSFLQFNIFNLHQHILLKDCRGIA